MCPVSPENPPAESVQLLCLRVTAEADPSALPRLLGSFQQINVMPRRVIAEAGTEDVLHIRIDVVGVSEHQMNILAAKLGQIPTVLGAYWHRI